MYGQPKLGAYLLGAVSHGEFSGGGQVFGTELLTGLPTKLAKEPLVDAVFEMRFDSDMPVSSIWPGILYSKLQGEKSMEQLPTIHIPKEFRDNDVNLTHAPLCKLSWENHWILIGDRVFAVAAKMPYSGWEEFKAAIVTAFGIVLNTDMIKSISRCSIKYVDILDSVPFEPSLCFNLELELGRRTPQGNDFHVRLGFEEGAVTHTLQIASQGNIFLLTGEPISGPLLDVDSIMALDAESPTDFLARLESRADEMHTANKRVVFDCLSAEALAFLEPQYE
jgi:uncharacterized protein (TIGR04255 family)